MKKKLKMWAVIDPENNNRLVNYYNLSQVYFTKKNAEINKRYYNARPLNHKYIVVPCELSFITPKK